MYLQNAPLYLSKCPIAIVRSVVAEHLGSQRSDLRMGPGFPPPCGVPKTAGGGPLHNMRRGPWDSVRGPFVVSFKVLVMPLTSGVGLVMLQNSNHLGED